MDGYPTIETNGCFDVLTEERYLEAWLSVDKADANDRLDVILNLEDPWLSMDSSHVPTDDFSISSPSLEAGASRSESNTMETGASIAASRSCESLVELADSITQRFRLLPNLVHRLRFVEEIQLKIVSELYVSTLDEAFRTKNSNLLQDDARNSTLSEICGILNSSQFMANVLRDWGEQAMFLELHYVRSRLPRSTVILTSQSLANDPEFALVSGTLFDDVVEMYTSIQSRSIDLLAEQVAQMFHQASRKYRMLGFLLRREAPADLDHALDTKDTRHDEMPLAGGSLEVSDNLCDAVASLKSRLVTLTRTLSTQQLMRRVWTAIAANLDRLIFSDIILVNPFTPAGIAQFAFDMRVLFSTFGGFSPSPALHFPLTSNALRIFDMDYRQRSDLMADLGILQKPSVNEVPSSSSAEQDTFLASLDLGGLSLREVFRICSNADRKWEASLNETS